MKLEFSYTQPITLLKNGKFTYRYLALNVNIECNCNDESLLKNKETEFRNQFNFDGSIFVSKDTDIAVLIPAEDLGMYNIIVVDNVDTLFDSILTFIRSSFISDTLITLNGIGVYIHEV